MAAPTRRARRSLLAATYGVLAAGLVVAVVAANRSGGSPPPASAPTPTPTAVAGDPKVTVTADSAGQSFTIAATNTSDVACHEIDLHVLGEAGVAPDPQGELLSGLSDGKLYSFRDVTPGQTVTQTLDAHAIVQSLPHGQHFSVGAVGYCMDSRR